jgi:diguanylate cyclase (GGDEF)-like protein
MATGILVPHGRKAPIALVVEPDETCAADMEALLRGAGVTARRTADAEAAWKAFAAEPPDVVFTTLQTPRRDAAWLLRRMREDWLGALPPVYGLADHAELVPATRELELDAVLLRPLAGVALRTLSAASVSSEDVARQASRLRDLFDLTLLGDDLETALATFVERVALNFRAADCVLWGPPHEGRWPKTRRAPGRPEEQAMLLWRCDLALVAGATIVASEGVGIPGVTVVDAAPARSVLAVPLDAPNARALGALCLVDDGARRFTSEERDALALCARRLARELAWRSAHDRLVVDHSRLRETAQKDPLTGVLTASALVEALAGEIARAGATGLPPAFAVLDVAELRTINDRHGHQAGDAVLQHVTSLCEGTLRREDHVGRLGGDELGVVLPGLSARDAQALLDRLRRAIAESPLERHGLDIQARVRAGLTVAGTGEPADEVMARAHSALREAKRTRAHLTAILPGETPGSSRVTATQDAVGFEDLADGDLLPAGATLGGMYQILHEISRGAMGVVYRAEDLGLGRPVAVKVLRADLARDAELVARFREEAAMLAALRHENLVQVYAFGAREHDVYFVMELVEGEQLADLMQRAEESGEPMAVEQVGAIVSQVAGALSVMHRVGAIHRDVKPANILLDRVRDRAVLVDVGVAKRRGIPGEAAGTPGFAAPESFTAGEEGPATDVYGLASTAYMMLTGLAPFGGGDVSKVIRRQLQDRPASPSKLRAELSANVDRVLLRALAPRTQDRHGSALEFADALADAFAEPPEPEPTEAAGSAAATYEDRTDSGESRGALFRVAYRILGNRLGSAWVRRAVEDQPELAEVLRPTVAPYDWFATTRLVGVLRSVPAQVRDPRKVARELGRATMTATLTRFLGADPASLTPEAVLGQVPEYWHRYHSWGDITVESSPGRCVLTIVGTPREPLVCCLVEGAFERIAELAGAAQAACRQLQCEVQGASACVFEVTWQQA